MVEVEPGKGVLLDFDQMSQCQRCQQGVGCGSGLFSTPANGKLALRLWLRTDDYAQFSIGQLVVVRTDNANKGWLGFVLISFALPLCGMISATLMATWATIGLDLTMGSAGVAHTAKADELVIMCSAVFGLAAGIFLWNRLPNKLSSAAEDSLCLKTARIETAAGHSYTKEMHNE